MRSNTTGGPGTLSLASAEDGIGSCRRTSSAYLWAFSAITASPGAKAHYRRRRDDHGDWHAAAQRNLFNRMIGQQYHCLQKHTLFDESTALPVELAAAARPLTS